MDLKEGLLKRKQINVVDNLATAQQNYQQTKSNKKYKIV